MLHTFVEEISNPFDETIQQQIYHMEQVKVGERVFRGLS